MTPEYPNRPPTTRRRFRVQAVATLFAVVFRLVSASAAVVDEPAPSDALLKFVPADAGLILTIDRLREHSEEILGSRLARDVQELPAFKTWLDTDKVRDLLRSRGRIEEFFQTTLGEFRDEVLGDAVVLALRLPPEKSADPVEARGLLVLRARDPKLLNRMVDLVNTTQERNGEIAELSEHKRGATVYHTRTFHAGDGHPPESFVIFPDGTFAFSNDEHLIHEVVDRKTAAVASSSIGSVADREGFKLMSAGLPSRAVCRLFVDPKVALRLLGGLPAKSSDDDRGAPAMLGRYLDDLDFIGAGLVVDDRGIKLHAIQAFEAEKFRESTAPLVAEPSVDRPGTRLYAVPDSATALVALGVDFPTVYRLLVGLVPAADRHKIPKIEALASGLSLGLDLRRQVLPALGPRVVAYLEPPNRSSAKAKNEAGLGGFSFPFVVAAEIDDEADADPDADCAPAVAAAIDNALNTVLTVVSLDEKRVPADARVETRDVDRIAVKSLNASSPFAYAVDRPGRRLILGSSAEAVARYLEAGSNPKAGARFKAIQAVAFPDCDAYACLDLAAIHGLAVQYRDRFIESTAKKERRSSADVGRDLDQVLGIVQLFDAAFFSTRVDAKNAALEHAFGLLPRSAAGDR